MQKLNTQKEILVSIIIPCFNVEAYIESAIDSCISQDYSPLEIICVDNGSNDGTVELIRKFSNVKLVFEENKGAPKARNKGIEVSKGEWIQFLDADDVLSPEKISRQILLATQSKETNIGGIIARYKRKSVKGDLYGIAFESEDFWKGLLCTQNGITSSNLWKREAVLFSGKWDGELSSSQEYDLMFRMATKGHAFVVDKEEGAIVCDRVSGSISKGNEAKNWKVYVELRMRILEYIVEHRINPASQALYGGIVLGQIRKLYSFDNNAAKEHYRKLKEMCPTIKGGNAFYGIMLRVFGFPLTQGILNLFGRH